MITSVWGNQNFHNGKLVKYEETADTYVSYIIVIKFF